jgi:hypothetical protein
MRGSIVPRVGATDKLPQLVSGTQLAARCPGKRGVYNGLTWIRPPCTLESC